MYNVICAIDNKGGLGYKNKLLYKIPKDLKLFKKVTINKKVVMGYNTFKSLGKPLQNRMNIIVTSKDFSYTYTNTMFIKNIKEIIDCEYYNDSYVIGGGILFKSLFDIQLPEYMLITHIRDDSYPADSFFPMEILNEYKYQNKEDEYIFIDNNNNNKEIKVEVISYMF